jgi:hypothetical protein
MERSERGIFGDSGHKVTSRWLDCVQVHTGTVCYAVHSAVAFHLCILWDTFMPRVLERERSASDITVRRTEARIKGSAINPSRQMQTLQLRVVTLCLNHSMLYSDFPRYTQIWSIKKSCLIWVKNSTPKGDMLQGNKMFESNRKTHSCSGTRVALGSYFTVP